MDLIAHTVELLTAYSMHGEDARIPPLLGLSPKLTEAVLIC